MNQNSQPKDIDTTKSRKRSSRLKLAVVAGLVVIIFAGVAVFVVISNRSVLGSDIVKEANFSVYAPSKLPSGYVLQQDKTSLDNKMLSYVISQGVSNSDITVTVQPVPKGFNMNQMIDKGSVKSVSVPAGTLYNLSAGGMTQYMLETGDSLVFMTSQSDIDTATINSLAESFVKQN